MEIISSGSLAAYVVPRYVQEKKRGFIIKIDYTLSRFHCWKSGLAAQKKDLITADVYVTLMLLKIKSFVELLKSF